MVELLEDGVLETVVLVDGFGAQGHGDPSRCPYAHTLISEDLEVADGGSGVGVVAVTFVVGFGVLSSSA